MRPLIPVFLCVLMVAAIISLYPAFAGSQTTTIHQVIAPSGTIAGSENPLSVSVIVYYNNTVQGYRLVVGILDAGVLPQRVVSGAVVSSTYPCVNEQIASALCAVTVPNTSGVVHVGFQVGGIFGGRTRVGTWNLNATSVLMDKQNKLVLGSTNSQLFNVNLAPVALYVDVPQNVVVSVDGTPQPAGPASVGVSLGPHTVEAPTFVNVSQSTRLRFDKWSDGSSSATRTVTVAGATTLQADYVTQNLLTLVGVQGKETVYGWYDVGSNATFSTPQFVPIPGFPKELNVRLSLQGWYENGHRLTDSPSGTISMKTPHTLTAEWGTDYSRLADIVLAGLSITIFAILLVRRSRTSKQRASRRPRRRSSKLRD